MDESRQPRSAAPWGRWGAIVALIVFVLIFAQAQDAGSVTIASQSVPVWGVMLVSYLLGAVAMWGLGKGKRQ
ncbi:hypothetical protein [Cellulomonas soli]|uniref:Uncharacterized protein n=1 Tax=Cellulomonas soli TaxID=931535 RepID=A0A512PHM3_9CELL|nr:hypothetical protein [Cellulomonas soli]NYI59190.1 type VI protein secretion system component VasF [Cellulomonas soli]GEP70695.1 hypothetical protein CSO01_34100 [Cellulomonas soli]